MVIVCQFKHNQSNKLFLDFTAGIKFQTFTPLQQQLFIFTTPYQQTSNQFRALFFLFPLTDHKNTFL